MKEIVIIGAGGMGRETLDIIEACNHVEQTYQPLGFIVDPQYGTPGMLINGQPILGGYDWLEKYAREVYVSCAIGPSNLRYQLIQRATELKCRFINLIHPSVVMTSWVNMGEGVLISAGCILTNNVQIGNHVQINLNCTISHDATLQDFVTLAPGVHITGNVTVGRGAYIGVGANTIQKIRIGDWAIIGAGSVITSDIPENSTVVGVPGKVIKNREPGWHLG